MIEMAGRPPRLAQLAGFVDRLWYVGDADRRGWELKLPTTAAQVIINLDQERLTTRPLAAGGTLACGAVGLSAIARSAVVLDRTEQRRTAGIVIRPESLGAVIGGSADDLDALVDLDSLIPGAAERLPGAASAGRSPGEVLDLLELELADLLRTRPNPDRICRAAVGLLRSGRTVTAVAEALGTSHSTLSRRFRHAVGMPPKHYQRLLRLERAIAMAAPDPAPDWAAIAARSGCYDQAHLIHEFDELAGLTPTGWHRAGAGSPFHLPLDDDFLQDRWADGHQSGDHERPTVPERDAVPALSRR